MPAGAEAPGGRPQGTRHGVDPGNRRCHAPLMTSHPTAWYQLRYRQGMAMNLRLPEDLAAGLRALAVDTGRSQQDLAREAIAALNAGGRIACEEDAETKEQFAALLAAVRREVEACGNC